MTKRPPRPSRGGKKPQGKQKASPAPKATAKSKTTRLNKFIANAGVCSRREADELIRLGKITVNGKTIIEMGFQVGAKDTVKQ